ncbi:MAG: tyrosine-type recombinase/integrase, partial [Thermomicrobia bacterium]|nr:tyrosine-type recombinase/integrase [Thermomicrobia bacterium]
MVETAMIPANTPDAQVIAMWMHGRSRHTQRAYRADWKRFSAFTGGKPIAGITLADVQGFADSLDDLAPASRGRVMASLKSLLAFAHRLGFAAFDVGRAVRLPQARDSLSERIITEAEVHRMIDMEDHPRNRTILRLLYASGMRVSELCGLRWRDLAGRDEGGQVTVFGKGSKTRAILIPATVWGDLTALQGEAGPDDPVFRSPKGGGPLTSGQVWRIVKVAAERADLRKAVSPHFLRHAHASHALDRGAPIHLVQSTLGHTSVATTGRYTQA